MSNPRTSRGSGLETARNVRSRGLTPDGEQHVHSVDRTPRWATGVSDGLWAAGCRHVVYVPDNPLSHILSALATDHPEVSALLATREEEAVGIAAGLHLGGGRPALLMQSSGVGNALNALGSLLLAYQIPAVLIISMRGDPGEWNWAQVPLGRAVVPVLDALGIQHLSVDRDEEARAAVLAVASLAFGTRVPAACLLPRRLTVPVEGEILRLKQIAR
jgi:sulfopyruvate decarboxylase alpha subunit